MSGWVRDLADYGKRSGVYGTQMDVVLVLKDDIEERERSLRRGLHKLRVLA